jgi:hypothetical protein
MNEAVALCCFLVLVAMEPRTLIGAAFSAVVAIICWWLIR